MWLRAAGLAGQAAALGSAVFALVVVGPSQGWCRTRALDLALRLAIGGALLAAAAQSGALAGLALAVADGANAGASDVLGSTVGLVGLVRTALAIAVALAAWALRRAPESNQLRALLLLSATGLTVTGGWSGHAAGRLDHRTWLVAISSLHQAAAAVWAGGLLCAVALVASPRAAIGPASLRRFSALALLAVTTLAVT